jgi:hypothetical protein
MAVVINEFEVVPAPSAPAGGGPAQAEGRGGPAHGPTPRDIELVVLRLHERAARVRAH